MRLVSTGAYARRLRLWWFCVLLLLLYCFACDCGVAAKMRSVVCSAARGQPWPSILFSMQAHHWKQKDVLKMTRELRSPSRGRVSQRAPKACVARTRCRAGRGTGETSPPARAARQFLRFRHLLLSVEGQQVSMVSELPQTSV